MQEITTKALKKLIDEKVNFVLLDCRTVENYEQEHLPGALNLHWKYVPEKAHELLFDKNAMIVTYCSGITCDASIKCYKHLHDAGYTNLIEYAGGLEEWKAHGHKTTKASL